MGRSRRGGPAPGRNAVIEPRLIGGLGCLALAATAAGAQTTLTALPKQVPAWVENYNPFNASTRLPSVVDFVYEPLVVFSQLRGGEPNYRLATDHAFSEDLSQLTFTLREGVTWSDGEPFTAEDVVFTFEMVLGNPALDLEGVGELVAGVSAPDERTVVFDLSRPSSLAAFDIVRVPVVAEHVWAQVEDPVSFLNEDPVGTGPLTEFTRFTEQEYVQCRNESYWDAASLAVDCMRFPQIANNDQALAAAARGELDWMGSFLPDIENTYVARDPDNHGYWFPPGSYVYFNLNVEAGDAGLSEAFGDVAFRRAVSMVMDRGAMVDIAGYGYPTVNDDASGLGAAYEDWANPQAEEEFGRFMEYDPDAAAEMLAEAGYEDSDGDGFLETPSGADIAFDVIVPNGWTDWVNTVQIAVEGLTALGIEAGVATPEAAVWTEQLVQGTYDAAINAAVVGTTPHTHLDWALHSRHQGANRFAASNFVNPEVDRLLDAFSQTTDEAEQREIMAELQMRAAEDMAVIPVFNNPRWYQYNTSRFTGFWNAENPQGVPTVHDGTTSERLLHLLSLTPVEG